MRAIFVGRGPHFKSGVKVEQSFQNIEIYNLMANILGLAPAVNNGTLAHVDSVLKQR
jgi:ectonucleotide pyrophosphatase/phosphodiesterase family protein 1/3